MLNANILFKDFLSFVQYNIQPKVDFLLNKQKNEDLGIYTLKIRIIIKYILRMLNY